MSNSDTDSTSPEADKYERTMMPGVLAEKIPTDRLCTSRHVRSESGPEEEAEAGADSENSGADESSAEDQSFDEPDYRDSATVFRGKPRSKIKPQSTITPKELRQREARIQDHMRDAVEVSRAIRRIIEERLFRPQGFAVLEEYGRSKFGIGAKRMCQLARHVRVYDLLEANQAEIRKRIGPDGAFAQPTDIPLPVAKPWARPLHRLANQERTGLIIEVWAAVVRRYGSSITGRRVRDVRNRVLQEQG